uniref:Interferon regulatory factor 3 n=1 Tax=Neogobius melanostomus TaxID=47308 RepID=A0A8C6UMQ0_9GOBI
MAHSKPLLIPWLREQINSRQYPGVMWTNREETEFSIPWKHALRQDSSNTDILIFKAWAEVSGNGRASGDPSVWKRNFRSALRVKGFKMISDNKNDTANPHKIFRWPDQTGPKSKSNSSLSPDQPSPEEYPLPTQEASIVILCRLNRKPNLSAFSFLISESDGGHDILQECLEGLNIGPGAEGFEPPPEQQPLVEENVIGANMLRGQSQHPFGCEGVVPGAGLLGQPEQPEEGLWAESAISSSTPSLRPMMEVISVMFYRGKLVSEQLIQNESGVRIIYRPHLLGPALDSKSGLTLVSLPSPANMADQLQASYTRKILDSLGWLDVGVSGHMVYGHRHGETRAYWSFSNLDQSRQPREVPKEPRPLYMFKDFVKGMQDFINGKEKPPSSLFFCLGEKWPDPENKQWSKKLIMVEVNETAFGGRGASSLQSVELQISLQEMMEMY